MEEDHRHLQLERTKDDRPAQHRLTAFPIPLVVDLLLSFPPRNKSLNCHSSRVCPSRLFDTTLTRSEPSHLSLIDNSPLGISFFVATDVD